MVPTHIPIDSSMHLATYAAHCSHTCVGSQTRWQHNEPVGAPSARYVVGTVAELGDRFLHAFGLSNTALTSIEVLRSRGSYG